MAMDVKVIPRKTGKWWVGVAVLEEEVAGWKETKNAISGKILSLSIGCLAQAHNPGQLSPPMSTVQPDPVTRQQGLGDSPIPVANLYWGSTAVTYYVFIALSS